MTTTTPHGEVESWTAAAACGGARRSVDPDAMFVRGAAQRDARQVCFACVVRTTCLVEALEAGMEFGVWGGLTERERRAMVRAAPIGVDWSARVAADTALAARFEEEWASATGTD
ncbi:WhiB family transcriptional regulator [Miniimonas sp. S16]|uniref:WhiB family transcriptional regulator n=1 Tax=Miniimonas sp. S16 TaxID=2171623 RepID=UPI000D528F64|nr:WhiB family transcriptional regulator [Miniimonas sp. S16]